MSLYFELMRSNMVVDKLNKEQGRGVFELYDLHRYSSIAMESIKVPIHKAKSDHKVASTSELVKMVRLARASHDIGERIFTACKVGKSTVSIDEEFLDLCIENGVFPASLNYMGFPKSCCICVNEVIAHGAAFAGQTIGGQDIITLDYVTFKDGVFCDMARTFSVEPIKDGTARKLVSTARQCLQEAFLKCRPGARFSDIGGTMEKIAQDNGFQMVPDLGSHFILDVVHGNTISNRRSNDKRIMQEGMTFTIEPLLIYPETKSVPGKMYKSKIVQPYYQTSNGTPSAHFEDTIVITESGACAITSPNGVI